MSTDALRAGFHDFFGVDGPELPDRIPSEGAVSAGGWTARYVHRQDAAGEPVVDFVATFGMEPPMHGRVTADGQAVIIGSFRDHYSFNPAIGEDEGAGRARMERHNQEVADELRRVGLL
jgi:hypothetical protein